ncbi:AAA family ATPase [Vibrio sp. 10N.222.54.B12]|uniref:phosphoribosyltransferase-like protein n=1 Tax=Vibrio sp. 10N.222.54.B12 TaxID=3229636 RepID=UPI00354B7261
MDTLEATLNIEKAISTLSADTNDDTLKLARLEVRGILQKYADLEEDKSLTLIDSIKAISDFGTKKKLRNVSLLVLRLNSIPNFFPKQSAGAGLDAKIIALLEPKLPDFYKRFDIDKKSQTYEKLDKLYEVHDFCLSKLNCLTLVPAKIESITAEKQMILKSVGDKTLNSYLSHYEFPKIRSSIEVIITQVVDLSKSIDSTFTRRVKELSDLLGDELRFCQENYSFITNDFYAPFLEKVKTVIDNEAIRSKERFRCEIVSRNGSNFELEKKYPLYRENEDVKIYLALRNTGPGIAEKVTSYISEKNDDVLLYTEDIDLGSVQPGDFVLPISFNVCTPLESVILEVVISWEQIGVTDDNFISLSVTINAQSSTIDWESLKYRNPYSLDIAIGADFYGRRDKLDRLVSRAKMKNMQSSYITGQRRVGKSSLAKAVEDSVTNQIPNCHVLNIECGDFKHPDAVSTVNALGENIEYFLSEYLPQNVSAPLSPMNGSLASLSRLIMSLGKTEPDKKFLIIIDEFDEINQELYRFSEIAETFFLNIRSLSGKRNISFCLIGAERMSFVMSSQGEKLNKFSRESLNTFKQDEEWQDYEDLIKSNLQEIIIWHDNAIRAVHNITNGHPYFTKQICSAIFDNAVASRDSEISIEEVEKSVAMLVSELDVNAFQHFWRDGIQGELDEVEIITLKRCRILVGYARAKRLSHETTVDNIKSHVHSNQITEADLMPILTDFCRRGIMQESDNSFHIVIPLFELWLVNQGFNLLIADQLGDELAEKRQLEEDKAYISDKEIEELLDHWPSYRGVEIVISDIRNWISQVSSHIQQRLLFNLLKNIRFYGDRDIRSLLKSLHEKIRRNLPVIVQRSKAQRRKDIWITYVDGPGKSGAQFASQYAEENLISTTCVKEISELDNIVKRKEGIPNEIQAIIVIDDFIGSGNSLSTSIEAFYERNGSFIRDNNVSMVIGVLCGTPEGEEHVRTTLSTLDANSDLVVCETLENRHFAFGEGNGIWADIDELHSAKELCQRLGIYVDKSRPLGYNEQGLLVVFSRNCPNNTLPILHSIGRGEDRWKPLFERIKH